MLKASTKSEPHSSPLALATTQRLPLPSVLSDAHLPTSVGSLGLGTSHGGSQSHDEPSIAPYPTLAVLVPYRTPPWCCLHPGHPPLPAAQVVTQPPGQEVNPCRDGQEIVQQVAHTRAGPAGPGPRRHPSDWHCRRSPRRARQGAAGRDAAAQGRLLHLHEVTSSRGTYLVSRGRWSFWCPPSALLSFSCPQNPRLPSSSPRSWPGGPASRDRERKRGTE